MTDDLIAAYLVDVRRSLRWRADAADLVLELEDHLRESVEARVLRGAEPRDAEAETLSGFGSPRTVARAFAVNARGELAAPTRISRACGGIAVLGALLWLGAAAGSFVGQGELFFVWRQGLYEGWSAVTIAATLCVLPVLLGTMFRVGGQRDPLTWLTVGLVTGAAYGLDHAMWQWYLYLGLLSVAAGAVLLRARPAGVGGWGPVLLAAAWPLGLVLFQVMTRLEVGYSDGWGEYPTGRIVGFAAAAACWAVGLAILGAGLWRERPLDLRSELA